jgi:hypothetical protein
MPNNFLTIGLCGRDYERLEEAGKEDFDEVDMSTIVNANLCELALRMPDELRSIVASEPDKTRYKHKQTGETWGDCNGPTGDDRDQWEAVKLTAEEIAGLIAKYGATNWFDWCVDNWGTKWGTYGTKFYELGGDGSPILIEFQTAWSPPLPKVMQMIDDYICKTYFLKDIKWLGHEPYDNTAVEIEIDEAK